ncbi:hypothetical protein TNIN_399671 [Trichonephila inaurata madagascariensis]|uniref:Uncharacterized protein n=1 Tax=Trichonephila inaurata madagascariensis TaxID=2747483 RepID=A0A8X6YM74_9ARAC|nr:hypothetical protein TNIN_399671 [Trichonephila inaurata madagascariensis]
MTGCRTHSVCLYILPSPPPEHVIYGCMSPVHHQRSLVVPSPLFVPESFDNWRCRLHPQLQPTPEQSAGLQFDSGLSQERVSLVNSRARVGFFVFSVKLKDEK